MRSFDRLTSIQRCLGRLLNDWWCFWCELRYFSAALLTYSHFHARRNSISNCNQRMPSYATDCTFCQSCGLHTAIYRKRLISQASHHWTTLDWLSSLGNSVSTWIFRCVWRSRVAHGLSLEAPWKVHLMLGLPMPGWLMLGLMIEPVCLYKFYFFMSPPLSFSDVCRLQYYYVLIYACFVFMSIQVVFGMSIPAVFVMRIPCSMFIPLLLFLRLSFLSLSRFNSFYIFKHARISTSGQINSWVYLPSLFLDPWTHGWSLVINVSTFHFWTDLLA